MNLTVSLDLAKRMKDLGWEQVTEFNWYGMQGYEILLHKTSDDRLYYDCFIFAPTSDEILRELPYEIDFKKEDEKAFLKIEKSGEDYSAKYVAFSFVLPNYDYHKTFSEALGLLWCYLKENKLIG